MSKNQNFYPTGHTRGPLSPISPELLRGLKAGSIFPIVKAPSFSLPPEKEEIKTTKEQEDKERKEAYEMAEKISGQIPYLNPGAILIFRYFPSRFTKGGLEKPEQARRSEA